MLNAATMTSIITILLVCIAMALVPRSSSFSIQRSLSTRASKVHSNVHRPPLPTSKRGTLSRINLSENDSDEDDDGWGVETTIISTSSEPSSASSDRISKSQELAKLQNDLAAKQSNRGAVDSSTSSGGNSGGEERDLFIPIVTLVSVMGFTGLYGYEMLRLYSRGELYLPWEK